MCADASQATKGGEERLVSRSGVEDLAEVVGGIDGNGAVVKVR